MRVMQLTWGFDTFGGIESWVLRFHELLQAQGHESLLVMNNDKPLVRPEHSVLAPGASDREDDSRRRSGQAEIVRVADEYRPDIVLSHELGEPDITRSLVGRWPVVEMHHALLCSGGKLFRNGDRLCKHRVGARCLIDWYLEPCGTSKSPLVLKQAHELALRKIENIEEVTAVVVGSEFMQRYIANETRYPERIHCVDIYAGMPDVGRLADRPVRIRRQATPEEPYNITFVGRIAYAKGPQYLLDALQYLDPDLYRVTIVGDGWYAPKLKELTAQKGLEGRVVYTGALSGDELNAAYDAADVVVVPSIWPEPVASVVPEARGHGVPVVVFDVGGLGEWDQHLDAIYKARHADARSLAESIKRAATDPAECLPRALNPRPPGGIIPLLEKIVADYRPRKS